MTKAKPDPGAALGEAVERYRAEKKRAAEIERTASQELGAAVRKAYDGGVIKADIIRGIDHEWSRTWVDRAIDRTGIFAPDKNAPK